MLPPGRVAVVWQKGGDHPAQQVLGAVPLHRRERAESADSSPIHCTVCVGRRWMRSTCTAIRRQLRQLRRTARSGSHARTLAGGMLTPSNAKQCQAMPSNAELRKKSLAQNGTDRWHICCTRDCARALGCPRTPQHPSDLATFATDIAPHDTMGFTASDRE
jgi:hypothetical protein